MARNRSKGRFGVLSTLNLLAFLPLASRAPQYGRLLWALASDARVPMSRKLLLGLAAGYVLSPIDLIPDSIPVIGALDDVAVVVLAVDAFLESVPEMVLQEKLVELGLAHSELEADLTRMRKAVPKPVRQVFAKLPDVIEGVATFVAQSGFEHRLEELVDRYVPRDNNSYAGFEEEEMPA